MVDQQQLHSISAAQVFRQKLKNVLSEHHNDTSEMKLDGVAAASLLQDRNTQEEFHLRMDVQSLQSNRREKDQHSQNLFRELQLVRAAPASGSGLPQSVHTPLPLALHRSTRWS